MTLAPNPMPRPSMATRLLRQLARYRTGRFLIDVWFDPIAAWRRLRQKRTWPSPAEFAAMTDDQFGAYMRRLDQIATAKVARIRSSKPEQNSGKP